MPSHYLSPETLRKLNTILRPDQTGADSDTEHLYRNIRVPSVYHPDIYESDNNRNQETALQTIPEIKRKTNQKK